MAIFVRYHETPLVWASNLQLLYLQLLSHLLVSTTSPLLIHMVPNSATCLLCPVVIGIGFTTIITVNISKAQKVFMIHHSRIMMSKKEVVITKASEWFAVALLVNSCMVMILSSFEMPQRRLHYNEQEMTKDIYCSNNINVLVQLSFAFLLLLFNGV